MKTYIYLVVSLIVLTLGSCKNEISVTGESKDDAEHELVVVKSLKESMDSVQIILPHYGATVMINGFSKYNGVAMPNGEYNFSEDQGVLYVQTDLATVVPKKSRNENVEHLVIPLFVKPNDREETLHFLGLFTYEHNLGNVVYKSAMRMPEGITVDRLTENDGSVEITYMKNGSTTTDRYIVGADMMQMDHSTWIGDWIKTNINDGQAMSEDAYQFSNHDIDYDGKDEIFIAINPSGDCADGACTVYILDDDRTIINEYKSAQAPIHVLKSAKEGQDKLSIQQDGQQIVLSFDGSDYVSEGPSDPENNPQHEALKVLIK